MDSSFPLSPSSEHASRSSSLRQQREAALRRRQSLVPPRRDSHCAESARPASRRMSLGAINAISDVMAWEEAKTKERIEARIRKDEDKRAREATKSPEVEVDDREVRMKEQWSPEAKARAEAACKLEEDARKLAEANAAEAQRREKERFADLERRLAEAERARSEAEQLAERALLLERHHTLHGSDKISNGRGNLSDTINSPSTIHPKASHSNHSSVPQIMNESAHTALEQHNSTMGGYNEVARVHVPPDTTGRNSGYERYLATFHQPSKVDDSSITGSDDTEQNKQSVSSSSDDDTSRKKDSNNPGSKISSLPKVSSIDSINLDDPKAMRCFLMKPCPKGEGMVQCSVRRNKGLFPEYRMYLSRSNSKTETFLLTSKKRVGNKSSNYLISMSRNDHDKNSDGILGKLRSNFLGTEYQLYDHGMNPEYDDAFNEENNNGEIRIELGAIVYANNTSLGSKGPRQMNMCINKIDADGNSLKIWQPKTKDDERMMTCLKKQTSSIDKLVCFESKPPVWNNDVGAHVLYFNGKATMASVKNFQLCTQNDEQHIIMQFGRIDKEEFSLEVQWPMSLFQAFAAALSSFDSKLGCD